jgi:hypothetical protein
MALELNTDPTWLGQPAMPEDEDSPLTLGQTHAGQSQASARHAGSTSTTRC